jgi:peptidoglycan/LPS O-acetylase OafA/YrhL
LQTTFGPILLGAMLAYVLNKPRGFSWASRLVGWRPASLVALGLVLVVANYSPGDMSGWPRIAQHWAMMALVASCVVREANMLAPLLSLWPMRRIGVVSYGIYLYHLLVMHFVLKGLSVAGVTQGFFAFVGTILGTWAVAELSYRLFESRFLALKARYRSQNAVATLPDKFTSDRAPTLGCEDRANIDSGSTDRHNQIDKVPAPSATVGFPDPDALIGFAACKN